MDAGKLAALKGSIRKWQGIVDGTMVDEGAYNCPLCALFRDESCYGCPVRENTGRAYCDGSPYEEWDNLVDLTSSDYDGIEHKGANTPERIAAAQKELDYLKSLLPKENT